MLDFSSELGEDWGEKFDMKTCWTKQSVCSVSVGAVKVTQDTSEINSASLGKHYRMARD